MGCSLSTKNCLLYIFTILYFGLGLHIKMDILGLLGFYTVLTPCMCCWIASGGDKSDEPRFPYNRPLRSIYRAPDPSRPEKMAERALELENYLEGSRETSSEEQPIPKPLSQKKLKLSDGREISLDLELTLDVENIVTQSQKHEGTNSNEEEVAVQKESDVDEGEIEESSKREDGEEHQELSLDKVPLEFLYVQGH